LLTYTFLSRQLDALICLLASGYLLANKKILTYLSLNGNQTTSLSIPAPSVSHQAAHFDAAADAREAIGKLGTALSHHWRE
jgi:hypothetical protein